MALMNPAQGASYDVQRTKEEEAKQLYKNNLFPDPNKPELVVFLQESDYKFVNGILMEQDRSNFNNQEAGGRDGHSSNGEEENGSEIHPAKSLVFSEDSTHNKSHQCSGNVSHRSTASTASNQSFAFPVMPPEWPGSPVRMAEPDRRQLRKQESWKICCLCCKF